MNPDALALELNNADPEVRLAAIQHLNANPDLPIPDATLPLDDVKRLMLHWPI